MPPRSLARDVPAMTLDPSAADFDPSLFPTAFRQERIRRGVSLDELARRTGLRLSVLWEIESGEIPADEHLARMLLVALQFNAGQESRDA
jgi:ribosome-binding protein aMBF1 (putative translation factor)